MDSKRLFLSALMVGATNSLDIMEDRLYASLLNDIDVINTDAIPIAGATISKDRKPVIYVNVDRIADDMPVHTDMERMYMLRAIVKHEMWHIYAGHIFMLDRTFIVPKDRIEYKHDVVLNFRDEMVRYMYNLATDSMINSNVKEFRHISGIKLVPPEIVLDPDESEKLAKDDKLVFIGETTLAGKLLRKGSDTFRLKDDYTAEELTAVLYLLYKDVANTVRSGNGNADEQDQNSGFANAVRHYLENDMDESALKDLPENVREAVKDFVQRHISEKLDQAKALRGFDRVANGFELQMCKGKINWRTVLKNTLAGEEPVDSIRLNKHRINKRFGTAPKLVRDRVGNILALVDTSMSVDDELLKQFVNELYGVCEANGGSAYLYTYSIGISERQRLRRSTKVKVTERGGTSLENAIKEIGYDQPSKYDTIIVLTDGFDEFPTELIKSIHSNFVFVFPLTHDEGFEKEAAQYGKVIILD